MYVYASLSLKFREEKKNYILYYRGHVPNSLTPSPSAFMEVKKEEKVYVFKKKIMFHS